VVFTAATVAVLGLSDVLLVNQALLQRLDGVVTIVMGLVFLGVVPVLQRRMRGCHAPRDGLWGPCNVPKPMTSVVAWGFLDASRS
jgi:cytochrome c-type biogenesis protein